MVDRRIALALAGTCMAALASSAAGGAWPHADPRRPPVGVVRDCASRVESGLFVRGIPGPWRRRPIRAGPLGLVAREYARSAESDFAHVPGRPRRFDAQKLLVVVQAGRTATLAVPWRERKDIALPYDPSKWNRPSSVGYGLADGDRAATFKACAEAHLAWSGGVVGKWTEFNGAVVVAGARCAALDVGVPGRVEPLRRVLSFGKRRCRTVASSPGSPQRVLQAASGACIPGAWPRSRSSAFAAVFRAGCRASGRAPSGPAAARAAATSAGRPRAR
jgi:hypothetical protein